MKLYELTDNYRAFMEAVENGDIPEEAIADTLEGLEGTITDKADNIACLIKEQAATLEAMKTEQDRMAQRIKAKQRHIDWLKDYLAENMRKAGWNKLETVRSVVSFRRSTSVQVDMEVFGRAPESANYLVYAEPRVDKKAIGDALKCGMTIPGCELVTKESVQIK